MMSKLLVYILDKVVWMLLITVLTTQALQIAGVLQSPKSLSDITYTQENNYEFKISAEDIESSRGKRQTGERSAVLDGIFNIPIATLNAINELLQRSWPAFQRFREQSAVNRRRLEEAADGNGNTGNTGNTVLNNRDLDTRSTDRVDTPAISLSPFITRPVYRFRSSVTVKPEARVYSFED